MLVTESHLRREFNSQRFSKRTRAQENELSSNVEL